VSLETEFAVAAKYGQDFLDRNAVSVTVHETTFGDSARSCGFSVAVLDAGIGSSDEFR
jgi:hypothetical protein